jgi:alginate O-acetyltransferase complex protein AlgI
MVFTSHIFIFYFLLFSLAAYYATPGPWRHVVFTLFSYVFYGWWNPWFVLLMGAGTVVDYYCGRIITAPGAGEGQRRFGLLFSIISNLLVLAFFKYAGWAVGTASSVSAFLGLPAFPVPEFIQRIVLPVGISFYVFQSLSYCIDLYRRHAPPAKSLGHFACFVSLYPHLVAGPIVRYSSIAGQLSGRIHTIEAFTMGLARFCLGFCKKIMLADPLGVLADAAFNAGPGSLGTAAAWFGVVAYAFQIYFDFSAYSDMAVGLGRMFGFRIVENFKSPYLAASLTEFWRRWHISLSTFLRDYLYIPLGGNRKGAARTYVNLMTVMVIGGLWHGAATTFLVWGAIHGLMLALERWRGRKPLYGPLPRPLRVALTFVVLLVTWVFFRADHFAMATGYLGVMFAGQGGENPAANLLTQQLFAWPNLLWMAVAALVVWCVPNSQQLLERLTVPKVVACLAGFVISLGLMFAQGYSPFLYFQF